MDEPSDVIARLAAIRRTFPNAKSLDLTSARTLTYNCIAWAMGDTSKVWWPFGFDDSYWPPGVNRSLKRVSFEDAFWCEGYRKCSDGALVEGTEKVCLYENNGKPTHAARQLPNGRWTSKLGPDEDVEHDLNDLTGRRYGRPTVYFSRPRAVVVVTPDEGGAAEGNRVKTPTA